MGGDREAAVESSQQRCCRSAAKEYADCQQQPVGLQKIQAALIGSRRTAQPQHYPQRGCRSRQTVPAVPAEGDKNGDKGVKAAQVRRDLFYMALDVQHLKDDK